MAQTKFDYEKCLADPKHVFGTPENVVKDARLDRLAKIEILRRWEQDERALARAENESMGGGEEPMLARVYNALDYLLGR